MSLSRKIIILKAENQGRVDFNYYYKVMKVLYRAVTNVDADLGCKLHEKGYKVDNKTFKLFTFGIGYNDSENDNKGFIIRKNEEISLTISGKDEVLNLILKSIIKQGYLIIEDIKFTIKNVQDDEKVRFNKIMLYRVQTPIVESIYNAEEKRIEYLNIFQISFYNALAQNLMRKYELVYGKKYDGNLHFDIEDVIKAKKRYIRGIKKNGFIIGYSNFEIFIEAREDMQKVAYYTSLGQNSSMGMGLLKYIIGRRYI